MGPEHLLDQLGDLCQLQVPESGISRNSETGPSYSFANDARLPEYLNNRNNAEKVLGPVFHIDLVSYVRNFTAYLWK